MSCLPPCAHLFVLPSGSSGFAGSLSSLCSCCCSSSSSPSALHATPSNGYCYSCPLTLSLSNKSYLTGILLTLTLSLQVIILCLTCLTVWYMHTYFWHRCCYCAMRVHPVGARRSETVHSVCNCELYLDVM